MCGRFTLTASLEEVMERFDIQEEFSEDSFRPSYNIAPTDHVLAVVNDGQHNRLGQLKWGLVPSWSKDEKSGSRMINARSESVAEKTSFKQAFQKRRCLVVADSFYEWKKTDDGKIPYRIKLNSGGLFAMAGIWERWNSPDGEALSTCSILTTDANDTMADIHDRMPVILEPEAEQIWMNPVIEDTAALQDLLKPYPDDQLEMYEVSTKVNSPKNNSPDLIQRAE